jgi:hypothetical protein
MKIAITPADHDSDLLLFEKWQKMNYCEMAALAAKEKIKKTQADNAISRALKKRQAPIYGIHKDRA